MAATAKVHLIFLYHPQADVRSTSIPTAILKRLFTLYGSPKNVLVGQIRYGLTYFDASKPKAAVSLETILSPRSKLAIAPLLPTDEFIRQLQRPQDDTFRSCLTDTSADVFALRHGKCQDGWEDILTDDARSGKSPVEVTCIADGLVAALEMFARYSTTAAPLARYVVHLIPDSSGLDLINGLHPHSNLNSTHDDWDWDRAANELGKLSAWPSTVALPESNTATAALSVEGERIHKAISDNLPSTLPSISDAPSILGPAFRQPQLSKSMLLSGLSEAAATAARAAASANVSLTARKRPRKHSSSARPVDAAMDSVTTQATTSSAASSLAQTATAGARTTDADKQAIQKVLFLQQQQQMMMRNVKILKQQEEEKGASKSSPTQHRLLDQFREQLLVQMDTLRSHFTNLSSGGLAPDLNVTLAALISIDKEATDKGIQLGGPSNVQALVQKHRQQQGMQQHFQAQQAVQSSHAPQQQSQAPNAAVTADQAANSATTSGPAPTVDASATAGAAQQARRPGGQPFWTGAITWNMALPNKQRNHAATFVTAQCAPNTKQEALMLPWPQRFVISEVQSVSLSAMQTYASTNATPCIMFYPRPIPVTGPDGIAVAPSANQTNETMYMMLARMIDSKKGCAYMKLQGATNAPAEAGIVIVPTAPPGGGNTRRLLGLVFRGPVPWHLFAPQGGASSTAANPPGTTAPVTAPQIVNPARPPTTPQAPQALFQQQSTPVQQHTQHQPQAQAAQPTPLPPSLGNLSAMSATQLAQQLPAWARQQMATAAAQQKGGASLGMGGMSGMNKGAAATNLFGTPGSVDALSAALSGAPSSAGIGAGNVNIDFSALASQLNFAARPSQQAQQQQQQQHQQQSLLNPSIFNQPGWNANAQPTNNPFSGQNQQSSAVPGNILTGMQGVSGQQGPSAVDLEALQRILGLNAN